MKSKIKKIPYFLSLMLIVILYTACEKDVKDEKYGIPYVYISQATLSDLIYTVPQGFSESTYNFSTTTDKVNINLSVARGSNLEKEGYTTTIVANRDTINTLIASGILPAATTVLMPTAMYSLPATVTVPDGQTSTKFLLSLDKTMVKTYAGKKLALGVAIASTSKYKINPAINKVIVIVDVNALKLP